MRNTIVHRSRTFRASLCPFLYQTRTLSKYIKSQKEESSRTVSKDNRASSTQDPSRRSSRSKYSSRSPPREALDEDMTNSGMPNYNQPGSTVTPAEHAAFRRLLSKFGSISNSTNHGLRATTSTAFGIFRMGENMDQKTIATLLYANTDTDVTNILSLFAPETLEMIQEREDAHAITDTKPTSKEEPMPYPAWRIRDAALNALKTVSESLDRALESSTNPTREYLQTPRPPDLAVWQILKSQVFAQMTALRSISSPSDTTGTGLSISVSQRTTLEDVQMLKTTPPCLKSLDPQLPLLPLLTILYPASTLLAIRTYLRHLPTSPSALAIMPQVKSMGVVSYLLTSNVHFFNALIHLYWTIYSDLGKVKAVVEELKQNHVEPNKGTAALLETIRRERDHDLGLGKGETTEGQKEEVGGQTLPMRSHQWWLMQRQGQDLEEFLEKINSNRRFARL